jgi:DHA2 family multidrug resistance protein
LLPLSSCTLPTSRPPFNLTFVCGFGLFGSVFIFPVLVQRVLGFSPTEAGYSLVPGALIAIAIMPIIGKSLGSGVPPIIFVVIGFTAFILHGYTSSLADINSSRLWFAWPQILRGLGTACLTVPLINQAMVGLKPDEMPSGIALTNMLRQIGGALGIAIMNTYVANKFVLHKTDLVSNLTLENPLLLERLTATKQMLMSKGYDMFTAEQMSNQILDLSVNKQSFLLSYLDGFILISVFFIVAIPFMFLLRSQKLDKETQAKIQEEAH